MSIVCLYARPGDLVVPAWTFVAGGENPLYPVSYLTDGRADFPFKANAATCTVRGTFPSQTLKVMALVGHNRPGTSWPVTSNGGLSTSLVVPATPEDDLPLTPWEDLRESAACTTLDITIPTGSGNAYVGELVLANQLRVMRAVWGTVHEEEHLAQERTTAYGVRLVDDYRVRLRRYKTRVSHPDARAEMLALARSARGIVKPWLLIPEETENVALWVRFVDPRIIQELEDPSRTSTDVEVLEESVGVIVA